MMDREILAGDRVMVHDPRLFIDDIKTPVSFTRRSATVIRRYGYYSETMAELCENKEAGKYPDCVDVVFDYDGRESKGHFTSGIELIP
jgi:hypothetical protein